MATRTFFLRSIGNFTDNSDLKIYEMKSRKKNGQTRMSKAARLVLSVKEYVEENLGSNLREKKVAGIFKISTSTLRYAFKIHGLSYHQFIEQQRMQTARRLIEKEGLLVKEAMYHTGYKNRSTFNKAFKKHFEKNPSAFQ